MANFKTRGIVIKRSNFGEADRLVTIFTEKYGKIRAIGKGVRKPLSKLAGHLELFCLVDFLIAEGRNLDIITGAETEKCFFNLRNNFQPTKVAFYIAEVTEKMIGEEEPHPEVFKLLEETLENLNCREADLMLPYFELNMLSLLGYQPELAKCVLCGKKATQEGNFFSFQEGGLACEKCQSHDVAISEKAIKLLRLMINHKLKLIEKVKIDKNTASEVKKIANDYLNYTHQQEFKSRKFLR